MKNHVFQPVQCSLANFMISISTRCSSQRIFLNRRMFARLCSEGLDCFEFVVIFVLPEANHLGVALRVLTQSRLLLHLQNAKLYLLTLWCWILLHLVEIYFIACSECMNLTDKCFKEMGAKNCCTPIQFALESLVLIPVFLIVFATISWTLCVLSVRDLPSLC